jgi:hypothetical protein
MIPKASQRGGGQQLATHLLNAIDNERVELLALRGAVARDLHGAFAEWEAQSTATKCRKYLYSLSINPDPQQRKLSRQEVADFIRRVETRLGLEHQPRAVVCHVKAGREHFHVAWSRIDTAKMKAVQLSNDRYKIRAALLEFTREKGLEIPHRMKQPLKDRFNERARRSTHAEKQQEERTGITKEQRRREITEAWNRTGNGQDFIRALEQRGYVLAQGDRRGYVVIDRHGEIHSLPRQIEGVKTKDINARLIDFPADKLPTAAKAREQSRRRSPIPLKEYFRAQARQRRETLNAAQQARRAALDRRKAALDERHRAERAALLAVQRDRNKAIAEERRENKPKGLAAFLGKITGIDKLRKQRQQEQDAQRTRAQRENIEQLTRRQERESRDLARQYRALGRVEKREARSLETRLRREIRTHERAAERHRERRKEPENIRPEFREIAAPPAAPAKAHAGRATGSLISDKFAEQLKARSEQKKNQQERQQDTSRRRGPAPE